MTVSLPLAWGEAGGVFAGCHSLCFGILAFSSSLPLEMSPAFPSSSHGLSVLQEEGATDPATMGVIMVKEFFLKSCMRRNSPSGELNPMWAPLGSVSCGVLHGSSLTTWVANLCPHRSPNLRRALPGLHIEILSRIGGLLTCVTVLARVCMHMCVPVYACMCMCTWLGAHMGSCVYACGHMFPCARACLCVVSMHACVCTMCMYVRVDVCMCIRECGSCVFTCTHVDVYHAHLCGDMHICVCAHVHTGTMHVTPACMAACVYVCAGCLCVYECVRVCTYLHVDTCLCAARVCTRECVRSCVARVCIRECALMCRTCVHPCVCALVCHTCVHPRVCVLVCPMCVHPRVRALVCRTCVHP